jgi:hypothetical protein
MNYPILDGTYIYDKINKKIEEGKDINIYEQFYLWSIHNRSKILYGLFILLLVSLIINGIIDYRDNKIVIQSGGDESGSNESGSNETPKIEKAKTYKTEKKGFLSKAWSGTKGTFVDVGKGFKSVGKGIGNIVVGKNAGEDMNKVAQAVQTGKRSFTKNISFRNNRDPSKMSQYELQRRKKLEETKANRKFKTLGAMKDAVTFFPLIDKFFGKIWRFLIDTKAGIIIGFILLVYGFGVIVIPLLLLYLLVKYTLKVLKKKTQSLQDYNIYKKLTSR